ncbi:MAG: DUF2520 domain-containing protein [Bacteroidia bacterium]|nr:DUF2520 domain-containing protein [Bacteroidia bacterium]
MNKRIVFIGAGRLASSLAPALKESGNDIIQVFSRSQESASILAARLNCSFTCSLTSIDPAADLYIFTVPDHALDTLPENCGLSGKCLVHTSGSRTSSVFSGITEDYGVFYPLQTFTYGRNISFANLPVFIQGSNPSIQKMLSDLAGQISSKVQVITDEQRMLLHLAAVFANNFSNHMYAIAMDLLSSSGLDFENLRPLILETAGKAGYFPAQMQTGPAIRNETGIIQKHIEMLNDKPEYQKIYRFVTDSIRKLNVK